MQILLIWYCHLLITLIQKQLGFFVAMDVTLVKLVMLKLMCQLDPALLGMWHTLLMLKLMCWECEIPYSCWSWCASWECDIPYSCWSWCASWECDIPQPMPNTSVRRSWPMQINSDLWKVPYMWWKITENDRCVIKKTGIHCFMYICP